MSSAFGEEVLQQAMAKVAGNHQGIPGARLALIDTLHDQDEVTLLLERRVFLAQSNPGHGVAVEPVLQLPVHKNLARLPFLPAHGAILRRQGNVALIHNISPLHT